MGVGGADDAAVGQHHQMGIVNGHQRREEQRLGVLEVLVEDLRHILWREPHSSQYNARMKLRSSLLLTALTLLSSGTPMAQVPGATRLQGLTQPVEILRDRWGINHIYAQNEADLFFAQGYSAAKDRLFQFEVWRRQATGTVAEILGPRELKRDIGARLHMFRGDLDAELNHYHPRGKAIIEAFVRGVNAYIAETERQPTLVPFEFKALGIKPGRWTP